MPDDPGRTDGRLNLEQQKKRAKELLRGLASGEPSAVARLARNHPKGGSLDPGQAQLADAQLVLARENGFLSWPRLKARADALNWARGEIREPTAAPDTPATLHVRCGSDIRDALKRAGLVGVFHEFADPYCQGPVRNLPREAFIAERASFVAEAYGLYLHTAQERLTAEYGKLDDLAGHDEVVLWFEHDSYDQLILAHLLATLAGRPLRASLICIDRAPAVASFVGLGQLAPEVIRLLWAGRTPIGPAQYELGAKAWGALAQPTPEPLFALARAGTPAVAPMAGALMRHLSELPSTRNGLSLTEQLALDLLAESGPVNAQALFGRLTREREPLPFLGDAMFWAVLRALASGPAPLIEAPPDGAHETSWAGRRISLTPIGEAVRCGEADRLAFAPPVRWVGGIKIDPQAPAWRWDDGGGKPVLTEPARSR